MPFFPCYLNTNLKAENIPVFPNLEKCRMVILPKGERGGGKKRKGILCTQQNRGKNAGM